MANLIITDNHQINDVPHFSVHVEGKDRAGITLGLRRARMLADVLENHYDEFARTLFNFIESNEPTAIVPLKEFEWNDVRYGLFADGVIKMYAQGQHRSHWRKVTGKMAELITPATFDDPSSLDLVITVKPAKVSKASVRDAEMEAMKANMERMQTMMAQLLAMQTVKA